MKKVVFILFLLISSIFLQAQRTSEKLDQLLSNYAHQYKFNGSALVAQKGIILLEKGYGWRNIKDSLPNDANSIFQIGSVTKQFTAAIILKLQEQKKLSVQDRLSKYFPDYPKGDSITLYNLLTHTSGIYNYTNDGKFMAGESIKPATQERILSLFKDKPLDFSPGTKFSYSNSGYMLLGYIIEKVTQKPYEQVMRQMILQPLNMNHSGFNFTGLEDKNKATGYFMLDGRARQLSTIIDSTVAYSAGALYTTVGDLYKWERSIYTSKVLQPSSWKMAFTPFKSNYGFGWIIDSLYGKKIIWHNGGIFGFNSHLLRFPDDELVIILISNKSTPLLNTIANNLAAIVYDKPYEVPKERKEIKLADSLLHKYVGVYEVSPDFIVTVTMENGQLKAQATAQPKFDLFAEREDFFFLKAVEARVEFVRDAGGVIEKMIIYQGGEKTPGKKIK